MGFGERAPFLVSLDTTLAEAACYPHHAGKKTLKASAMQNIFRTFTLGNRQWHNSLNSLT